MNSVVEQDLDCLNPVTTWRRVLVNHQLNPRNSKKNDVKRSKLLDTRAQKKFYLETFSSLTTAGVLTVCCSKF